MQEASNYVYIVVRDGRIESVNCSDRGTAVCVFNMDNANLDENAKLHYEDVLRTVRQTTTEIEYWDAEEIY